MKSCAYDPPKLNFLSYLSSFLFKIEHSFPSDKNSSPHMWTKKSFITRYLFPPLLFNAFTYVSCVSHRSCSWGVHCPSSDVHESGTWKCQQHLVWSTPGLVNSWSSVWSRQFGQHQSGQLLVNIWWNGEITLVKNSIKGTGQELTNIRSTHFQHLVDIWSTTG